MYDWSPKMVPLPTHGSQLSRRRIGERAFRTLTSEAWADSILGCPLCKKALVSLHVHYAEKHWIHLVTTL
jgi:hypothetical protein